ncbi:MAG: rRNA maturation RNase YbeY [bacterium]
MKPTVEIRNTTRRDIPIRRLRDFASNVLQILKITGELSVSFVGASLISRLNRQYLGRTGDTDVLAFPQDNINSPTPPPPHPPTLLGDVVICIPRAFADAKKEGASPTRHLETLVLHGILHLAGHDHETDTDHKKMLEEEKRIWKALTAKKS